MILDMSSLCLIGRDTSGSGLVPVGRTTNPARPYPFRWHLFQWMLLNCRADNFQIRNLLDRSSGMNETCEGKAIFAWARGSAGLVTVFN
jgi:hypothetical protein